MAKLVVVQKKGDIFRYYTLTPEGEEFAKSEENKGWEKNWTPSKDVTFEDITQVIADLEDADGEEE